MTMRFNTQRMEHFKPMLLVVAIWKDSNSHDIHGDPQNMSIKLHVAASNVIS
jgi:hypothetical protein